MGYYYFYENDRLLSSGSCPNGQEEYQPKPTPTAKLVIGEPPCDPLSIPLEHYWSISKKTYLPLPKPIEVIWNETRYLRDSLLAGTDWRLLRAAETGVPVTSDWLDYRQALRDITNTNDPQNIVWPTPPES